MFCREETIGSPLVLRYQLICLYAALNQAQIKRGWPRWRTTASISTVLYLTTGELIAEAFKPMTVTFHCYWFNASVIKISIFPLDPRSSCMSSAQSQMWVSHAVQDKIHMSSHHVLAFDVLPDARCACRSLMPQLRNPYPTLTLTSLNPAVGTCSGRI